MQNNKLAAIGASDAPAFVKNLQKLPVYERFAKNLLQVICSPGNVLQLLLLPFARIRCRNHSQAIWMAVIGSLSYDRSDS